MSSYSEPEWAVKPPHSSPPWTLIEIKAGIEVARHDLFCRPTTVLGRAADMVHVPLHHESISRRHARISFDAQGNAWLRDLQSAHGTYVNKRRFPSEASGKVESNSTQKGARGILVFAGDILKFGASSRYFSLEGPPPKHELSEKDKLQAKIDRQLQQQQQRPSSIEAPAPNVGNSREEGVSWGISMGEDEDIDDKPAQTSTRSISLDDPLKIPEKYRKEWDKLNALKYKLANLENEDNRIRRKGDLTEGQEKQLQRNAEKEANLRKSIGEREDSLYDKLDNAGGSKRRKRHSSMQETSYADDEDDYFDRTKDKRSDERDGKISEEAESEETLTVKWKNCFRERTNLTTTVLSQATDRLDTLKERLAALRARGDEEAFFVENDLLLALESRKKVESSLARNATSMDGIEKLLKVVNPKLHWDRGSGYIGEGKTPENKPPETEKSSDGSERHPEIKAGSSSSTNSMQPPPHMLPPSPRQTKVDEISSMPPPSNIVKSTAPTKSPSEFAMLPPPNKKKRVLGPAVGPPVQASQPGSPKGGRIGTLAFLNHPKTKEARTTGEDKAMPDGSQKKTKGSHQQQPMGLSSDVWRAPEGQDGSGRTKLNEKFAGRY